MINLSRLYFCEEITPEERRKVLDDWHLPRDTLIHAGHCYVEYGCKYGDDDCPVMTKRVKQIYQFDPKWVE